MVLGCEIGAERILEHPDIERLKTENKKLSEKRKKLEADLNEGLVLCNLNLSHDIVHLFC